LVYAAELDGFSASTGRENGEAMIFLAVQKYHETCPSTMSRHMRSALTGAFISETTSRLSSWQKICIYRKYSGRWYFETPKSLCSQTTQLSGHKVFFKDFNPPDEL
jgi:hypothetical protein